MHSRFIPLQAKKYTFEILSFSPNTENNNEKPNNQNNGNSSAIKSNSHPDSDFQNMQIKNRLLKSVLCGNHNPFDQNTCQENTQQTRILKYDTKSNTSKPAVYKPQIPQFTKRQSLKLSTSEPKRQPLYCSKSAKVLDAPGLVDNFYYHHTDFADDDTLLVAIGNEVYSFDCTSNSTEQLHCVDEGLEIASVTSHPDTDMFALGLSSGEVTLVDCETGQTMRRLVDTRNNLRVSALGLSGHILGHGTKFGQMLLFDIRCSGDAFAKWSCHEQEVCSLRFSGHNSHTLASGGNDNRVVLYDLRQIQPLQNTVCHKAAVKALDFSRTSQRVLFSGGGSGDNTLCRWDSAQMSLHSQAHVGSQVCSLVTTSDDLLITAHGWPDNRVEVRHCESLDLLASFGGHTQRVLNVSVNPSHTMIVSSSADETLRFWPIQDLVSNQETEFLSELIRHRHLPR